jgi:hypothetical protein
MKVASEELRRFLGIASVSFVATAKPLAIVDMPLAG